MSVYAYVPPVNPIRFVEKEISFSDNKGYVGYGVGSYLDNLSYTEVEEPYYQPFKKDNIISLQIHTAAYSTLYANFYSAETGELIYSRPLHLTLIPYILSTNIVPGTEDEQLWIQLIVLQATLYSELNDHDLVWLEIEINFSSGGTKYLLSTVPLYLFTDNEQFSRIEYTCNTNKFDVFWANKNPFYYPVFVFFIEASKMLRASSYEHTTYDEMNGTTEELYSNVRDMYTFIGGGARGVPDFMLDILDRALACDNKTIDDKPYRLKEVGETSGKNPRQTKEYTLSEPEDELKYTFRQREVTLWERPASSYPYAVGNMTLQDAGGKTIRLDARILDASGDETALLSTLNSRASAAQSTGTFSESSGTFIFTNGEGESFALVSDIQVMPDELTIDVNVAVSNDVYTQLNTYNDSFDHYLILNWGLGSTITDDELWYNNGTTAITATKTYSATGAKTIRMFHKNEDTGFQNNRNATNGVYINDITGTVSSSLTVFRIDRHDFSSLVSLDLSFLDAAKDTLTNMVIRSSQLDGITAGWASSLVSGTYKPYTKIAYVDLSGNTFNSTFVDAFLNEFDTSTNYQPAFKTLNIKFMSPAAPPTGASSTARANIAAKFWTLFTD